MVDGYSYKPLTYYPLVFISTAALWSAAAWFGDNDGHGALTITLLFAGLVAPFVISTTMFALSGDHRLMRDFLSRLLDLRRIDHKTLGTAALMMPAALAASVVVSLPIGGELEQLKLAEGFSFSIGALPVLILLMAAALFEELGWRGYAFDSLEGRYDFLTASLIFSVLWSLWHLPLLWVNGSYQHNILHENAWYAVNFYISIVPMGIILSWVCRRSDGSVTAAVIFHFIINISQEMFEVTQLTKSIETVVLTVLGAILVALDRELFFSRKGAGIQSP